MDAIDLSSFEIISDRQVPQRVGGVGIAIGRVIRAKFAGTVHDVQFWYNWNAPDCPVYKITSVPVSE